MSEKIQAQHLSRKAMLYVRQSSAFQVAHNLESGKLQYAMQTRLRDLGFSEIEIIDEDLGRSAAGERAPADRVIVDLFRLAQAPPESRKERCSACSTSGPLGRLTAEIS